MAQYQRGNLFSVINNNGNRIICLTTNNVIKGNGDLVMGAGVALEGANYFPGLPKTAGRLVRKYNLDNEDYFFLLCFNESWDKKYGGRIGVGLLQTKRHYKDNSPVSLISNSVDHLVLAAENSPDFMFHSAIPGIGHGNAPYDIVYGITQRCPDNVIFWSK